MPKNLFQPGNQAARGHGKGRPKLGVVSLADEAARAVLEADLAVLRKARENPRSVSKTELHRVKERISRMCRGRIPMRVAVGGDEESRTPIPFTYVAVAPAMARVAEDDEEEEAAETLAKGR